MVGFLKRTLLLSILSFVFLTIIFLIPTGCTSRQKGVSNEEKTKINEKITKINLYVDYDMDFYSLAMSSVPGLPLKGRIEADDSIKNVRYHWTTDYGSFLDWNDSGIITELGSDFFNSGEKIYWSSLASVEEIKNEEFQISLELEDIASSEVLARAVLIIKVKDDGFYVDDSKD